MNLPTVDGKPSSSIVIILLLTVLSLAPALLVLTTSFTPVIVVLSLTRNALGVQSVPPNQVLVGLALFISLFIMAPTFSQMNSQGLQPYLKGEKTQAQAYQAAAEPLREFMLKQTRKDELAMFVKASHQPQPESRDNVALSALVPAFVLSELKSAFIIGFVIFIPFLVIDLVVSSSLMSMGMMMLPPVMVSLPFKLLLFVMVDGWGLIVRSLIASYHTPDPGPDLGSRSRSAKGTDVTDAAVVQLAMQAMVITAKLAGLILVVSLAIGFAVSLLQSVTQIQEVTLSFVPKLLGVAVVILVTGHWMLAQLLGYTRALFDQLPALLKAG